jgi:hypothetical protein
MNITNPYLLALHCTNNLKKTLNTAKEFDQLLIKQKEIKDNKTKKTFLKIISEFQLELVSLSNTYKHTVKVIDYTSRFKGNSQNLEKLDEFLKCLPRCQDCLIHYMKQTYEFN